jgi:hypothetical protein
MKMEYDKMIECKICNGSGDCSFCLGIGLVTKGFFSKSEVHCAACDGTGLCARCDGSGEVKGILGKRIRIRCPECGFLKDVFTRQRPIQMKCICGATVVLED